MFEQVLTSDHAESFSLGDQVGGGQKRIVGTSHALAERGLLGSRASGHVRKMKEFRRPLLEGVEVFVGFGAHDNS